MFPYLIAFLDVILAAFVVPTANHWMLGRNGSGIVIEQLVLQYGQDWKCGNIIDTWSSMIELDKLKQWATI